LLSVSVGGFHSAYRGGQKVTQADEEQQRRAERARRIGLFRYELIQDVIDPALSTRQRGRRARELAAIEHAGPFGEKIRLSRNTIDRWARWYRSGGFDALVPQPAVVHPRTPAEVLELAAALKRENPGRTAAQVRRILRATSGWAPSDRTLQRHFERLELSGQAPASPGGTQVFGRFEASRPNELWTGDALHGPVITGRKAYLFCFIDDHSRAVMAARFGFSEDTVRLAAALRPALAAAASPPACMSTTGQRSWTPGCCGRALSWGSSWCTRHPAGRRAAARSNDFSALSASSSWSSSASGPRRPSPGWPS
jgi:putative transposase